MIEDINKRQKKKFRVALLSVVIVSIVVFLLALMVGQYGFISPIDLAKIIVNLFGADFELPASYENIIQFIRLPRTLAAFLVGGALSISGLVYQNTFNNKLISPDILGVSAGACVGAGIAILMSMNSGMISFFAFVFGAIAVIITLVLPKFFRNKSTITLVLAGIIVGAFMNSIIGLLKFLADEDDKLAEITFWMMGSVTGIQMKEVLYVTPLILIPMIILIVMSHRIDVVSLGKEEAQSLGVNYKRNRLIIIACSTVLTAASVSISGNVGWVGLVIPHIARAITSNRSGESLPISFFFGGAFMMAVDIMSRTFSKDDIPLSIITGILGAVIYSVVLVKKGRTINE